MSIAHNVTKTVQNICVQRRFGAHHMRARFRLPAGGINVPLTRRETSRRCGSVAGWRQYWNATFALPSSLLLSSPPLHPFRPVLPGLRAPHPPVPFKARNSTWRSLRSRKQDSNVEETKRSKNIRARKQILPSREATLKKFNRLARSLKSDDSRRWRVLSEQMDYPVMLIE